MSPEPRLISRNGLAYREAPARPDFTSSSLAEGSQVAYDCSNVGFAELAGEPGHFSLDPVADPPGDTPVAEFEIVQTRAFIAAGVFAMAMRTIFLIKVAPGFLFSARGLGLGASTLGL